MSPFTRFPLEVRASINARTTQLDAAKSAAKANASTAANHRGRLAVALAFIIAVALLGMPVRAKAQSSQAITVADGSVSGLIAAIQTLNANGGGIIELATNGSYSVTTASDWWYGPNAFPAISSNILIEGNGSTITRASGSPKFRFFFVSGGLSTLAAGTLTLQDLTLSGGLAQGGAGAGGIGAGGGGGGFGGAIYNQGTTYLSSVTFTQNEAIGGSGGGGAAPGGNSGGGGMGGNGGAANEYSGTNTAGGGGFQGTGSNTAGGNFVGSEGGTNGGGGGSAYGGAGGAGSSFSGYAAGGGGGGYASGQNGSAPTGVGGGAGAYGAGTGGAGGTQGEAGSGGGAFGGGGGPGADEGAGGGGIGGGGGGGYLSGGSGGFGGGGGGGYASGGGGFGGGGGGSYQNGGSASGGGFGGGGGQNSTSGAAGGGGAGFGGAIFNQLGTVTAMNCSFITNTAIAGSGYGTATGGGGAVFNLNGAVTLESVIYSGNTATSSGGTALSGTMFYNLSHNGGNTTATATSNATLTLVDMTLSTTNGDLLNNQVNGTATVTTVASQPAASLSADGLAFGNQRLNVTTPAQTVTLTNTGTSPLTISSVVLAGSGYQFSSKTCGTMLNANASCAASVTFEATIGGPLDGSITFTDNSYASTTQVVTLTGHGIAVTQLGFATAPPALLTAGGNAGTISVQEEDANGSLDTYATDSITLVVTGPASYSATYTATASAGVASFDLSGAALSTGGTYTYTVNSTGLSSAIATGLVVQPSTNFGSVNVDSPTSPQLISVYMPNGGDVASIAVLTQGFAGLDFTSTTGGNCAAATYTDGQTCTVNVIFTPSVAGPRAGAVVLRDAGGNALATALVYGTGIGAQIGFGTGVQTEPFNFNGSFPGYGFAFDTAGNIFYGNASNGTIMRAPLVSGVYGTAVSIGSGFNSPVSVQVDGAGNVYVAQSPYFADGETIPPNGGYGSVTEIPLTATGYGTPVVVISQVATLAGAALAPSGTFYLSTGANGLYQASLTATGYGLPTLLSSETAPTSPVIDASGNVYFAGSSAIYEISSSGGQGQLFLQGGPTTISPSGLAADLVGNLYVADTRNSDLLEIAASPFYVRTVTTLLPRFGYFEEFVATDKSSNLYLYDGATGGLIERDVADPPSLGFAATADNSASATQTVAVNSIGNAALVFTNVSSSSTNFSLTGSSCSSTTQLSAGTSCNLVVAFTPVAPANGTVDGSVVLTNNNLPSTTQTIPLIGTAMEVLTLTPASLTNATVGVAYSVALSASGGAASDTYTYAATVGALPSGITLSRAGMLSGTPTSAGSFSFTITATDSVTTTLTVSQAYSLQVGAPTITVSPTTGTALSGTAETAFNQTFTASGGTPTYTYALSVTSGAMPTGLSFTSGGVLSGRPTASGTVSFTITAKDSSTGTEAPFSGTGSYTLTVGSPTISVSPTTLPNAMFGTAYSQTLLASGGTGTYTYTVTAGALPAGISLSSAGVVSGTPTTSGSFSFTVAAKDSDGFTGSQAYSLMVVAPTIAVSPATLATATVGVAYSATMTATGGTSPYSYSVSAGALPAGLTLSSTGVLLGTPTAGGSFSFTMTAKDSSASPGPYSGTAAYGLTVGVGTATLSFAAVPPQTYGNPPLTVSASSASTGAITYSVMSGAATINASSGMVTLTGAGAVTLKASQVATTSYGSATAQTTINVAQQASQTSVSAAPTVASPVQTVTLTATVSPTITATAASPSGMVTFFDNGVQLGTAVNVVGGIATLVVPSLPAGATAVITVTYSGDNNFLGSTSSNSASVMVGAYDFTFTNTGASAYTAAPGAVATYGFGLTPLYGSYAVPVSFTATGLPAGATASFTPSSVAVGGGATPVVVTVQTAAATAHSSSDPFGRGIFLALLFLPFLSRRSMREKLRGRMLLLVLLMAGLTATLTGCGSANGFVLQSPQTYTLTVTATSGTLQHSQTVTLIVQ